MIYKNFMSLKNFLEHLQLTYDLRIHIQNYKNMSFFDSQLESVLNFYKIHDCNYCMYIKSNKLLWNKCIKIKNALLNKCNKVNTSFMGTCHTGVVEYISPIFCNNIVIGYVSVGGFKYDNVKMNSIFQKLSKNYGLDPNVLKDNYKHLQDISSYDLITLKKSIDLVSEYISNIYEPLISSHDIETTRIHGNSKEDEVMYNVINYISINLNKDILVKDISKHCNCSKSYIHHLFKKKMNVSIRNYINTLRIEKSKYLLVKSDLLIKEIAYKVGFNDSNYFSKVFFDICDITPTDYKKSFK